MRKYFNRTARIKTNGAGGSTVKGSWWRKVSVGCTQGGVDSMELFTAMVDDLEDELARAGIRGVQFSVNNVAHQMRNLDFADDVTLLIMKKRSRSPWIRFNNSI